jgi:hypothetical protein
MKTPIFIKRLQQKWFPSEDDKVWKKWVDYEQREANDLLKFLTYDVRDSLKRRAIFLLVVPSAEFNPIYWTEEVGKFYQGLDFLKTLTPDLLSYATDLIVEFYTMLKPMHRDKPENFAQGGGGVTVYWSVPDKYHDALYFYNDCILSLLTMLPEEQCEKIFSLFSLRDISTYCNPDDASGYNPFQNLLYSNVDEKWKRKADATMRQIIKDELADKTKPREEWENALQQYAYIIKLQLHGENLPYSVDLFADQIQFLVSQEHHGKELIDRWYVVKIFRFLPNDNHKEIRYQIAKLVVFGNEKDFKVWNKETLQGANIMLNEFGKDDKKLAQRIQLAIEEYKKESAQSEKKQTDAKNAEEEIMNQMK